MGNCKVYIFYVEWVYKKFGVLFSRIMQTYKVYGNLRLTIKYVKLLRTFEGNCNFFAFFIRTMGNNENTIEKL